MVAEVGDDELMRAVARREPDALISLYDRYGRLAFALAYRVLGDAGAAEEAVQDAMLIVWRRAETFDPGRGSGLRAWLLTIVHHRAIDLLRRRRGAATSAVDLAAVDGMLVGPDPWGEVDRRLDRDRVRTAVGSLPDDQRHAIELAYFDGLTHREIAERTGAPLGTVKGRMRLGLQKLSGLLGEAAGRDP